MLLLKLLFVCDLKWPYDNGLRASFHIFNRKDDAEWRRKDPWAPPRSVAAKKKKRSDFPVLKWLSQAHLAHSQGAPLSLSNPRPVRLDVPSLSRQADSEDWSLVFSVLYSWLSFVCGMWLTALGSLFLGLLFGHSPPWTCQVHFTSVWDCDLGFCCRSHPHVSVQSLQGKLLFCVHQRLSMSPKTKEIY